MSKPPANRGSLWEWFQEDGDWVLRHLAEGDSYVSGVACRDGTWTSWEESSLGLGPVETGSCASQIEAAVEIAERAGCRLAEPVDPSP